MRSEDITNKNAICRMSRRTFVKMTGAATGAIAFGGIPGLTNALGQPSPNQVPLDPTTIPKYAHELVIHRVFEPTLVLGEGGEVIRHDYVVSSGIITQAQILPPPFPTTTVFGFRGRVRVPGSNQTEEVLTSPGSVFDNTRGIPSRVTWQNGITEPHFLPVDPTLHWANPNAMEVPVRPFTPFPPGYADAQFPVPLVVHLHGLVVRPQFDGTADEWFTFRTERGPSFVSNVYDYPNDQPATQLWYHDHSMGMTRLNVYAGLVGPAYFIRDPSTPLDAPDSPLPKGEFEVPLIIADRGFFTDGELNFPRVSRNPFLAYWDAETDSPVVVVNGKAWPNFNIKRQQYRFRILTASNERVWTLAFAEKSAGLQTKLEELAKLSELALISEEALEAALEAIKLVPFTVIGSDGGYLPAPQEVDRMTAGTPERNDILVDFSQFKPGTQIILRNIHAPEGVLTDPNTAGQVMQFTVVDSPAIPPPKLDGKLFPARAKLPLDAPTRTKVLVRFRTDPPVGFPRRRHPDDRLRSIDGLAFTSPPTELPLVGSTEQWDLVHTGEPDDDADAGTHLIHLHLLEYQVLNRQEFDRVRYLQDWHLLNGHRPVTRPIVLDPTPYLIGKPIPPEPNETGWKDVVRADPEFVTRIIARWAPQEIETGGVSPGQNLYPVDIEFPNSTDTFTGPGYVWHCHLVGHEDHDMMRTQAVIHAWEPGVSYPVGKIVANENIDNRVLVAHTSKAGEPPSKRFDLWERVNNNDGSWQPQIIFAIGDRVLHEGLLYMALTTHQAQQGQPPSRHPELWKPLPMTAKAQLVFYTEHHAATDPLAAAFLNLGLTGTEAEARAALASALAHFQHEHARPSSGIVDNPIEFTVPDGTTFTSTLSTDTKFYETTSQLKDITVDANSRKGEIVTVNGREMKAGVNYPLPPQRNHGYIIKATAGATFIAR